MSERGSIEILIPILIRARGTDRWAIVASLLATAKLNQIEPYAYLKDVLERMTHGHPANRIDDLLPWNWNASSVKT